MAAGPRTTDAAPAGIAALVGRWDPDVIDLPGRARADPPRGRRRDGLGRARARARAGARPSGRGRASPTPSSPRTPRPGAASPRTRAVRWAPSGSGACGCAAACTWASASWPPRAARAIPGGSPSTGSRRARGRLSLVSAGTGPETLLCLHGLGGTKASFLPTLAALAGPELPRRGARPARLRRVRQADRRALRRALVRARDLRGDGRARARVRPPRRQQHGRPGRDRGGSRSTARACSSLTLLCPALAWLRDRRWAPIVRLLRPELGLLQMAPRRVVEQMTRRLVPTASDGWAAAGRRRVPARLPDAARARRLLRRGAQHLPRRAARRGGLLDAARGARPRRAVHLGQARRARPDRLHAPRRAGAARRRATSSSTAGTCRSSSARARRTAAMLRVPARAVRYNCWMSFPPGPRLPRLRPGGAADGRAVRLDGRSAASATATSSARTSRSSAASSTWPTRSSSSRSSRARPTVFHAGEANATVLGDALGENSLLTLDEGRHLSQRKLLLPPFHGEAVRRYAEVMADAPPRRGLALAGRASRSRCARACRRSRST